MPFNIEAKLANPGNLAPVPSAVPVEPPGAQPPAQLTAPQGSAPAPSFGSAVGGGQQPLLGASGTGTALDSAIDAISQSIRDIDGQNSSLPGARRMKAMMRFIARNKGGPQRLQSIQGLQPIQGAGSGAFANISQFQQGGISVDPDMKARLATNMEDSLRAVLESRRAQDKLRGKRDRLTKARDAGRSGNVSGMQSILSQDPAFRALAQQKQFQNQMKGLSDKELEQLAENTRSIDIRNFAKQELNRRAEEAVFAAQDTIGDRRADRATRREKLAKVEAKEREAQRRFELSQRQKQEALDLAARKAEATQRSNERKKEIGRRKTQFKIQAEDLANERKDIFDEISRIAGRADGEIASSIAGIDPPLEFGTLFNEKGQKASGFKKLADQLRDLTNLPEDATDDEKEQAAIAGQALADLEEMDRTLNEQRILQSQLDDKITTNKQDELSVERVFDEEQAAAREREREQESQGQDEQDPAQSQSSRESTIRKFMEESGRTREEIEEGLRARANQGGEADGEPEPVFDVSTLPGGEGVVPEDDPEIVEEARFREDLRASRKIGKAGVDRDFKNKKDDAILIAKIAGAPIKEIGDILRFESDLITAGQSDRRDELKEAFSDLAEGVLAGIPFDEAIEALSDDAELVGFIIKKLSESIPGQILSGLSNVN